MEILGVEIGDFGIRGCIADTERGVCVSEPKSTPALEDTTPHKVLAKIHELVCKQFKWSGPVGCAFPAPIDSGYILAGEHVDQSWIDANAKQLFSEITENSFHVINTTDAAGLAEIKFGAGRQESGLAILLALSSTFGSSLCIEGKLVPNIELGRMTIRGQKISEILGEIATGNPSKEHKAELIQTVLEHLEKVFHPSLFILDGLLNEQSEKTFPYIKTTTPFKSSEYSDNAQIMGAALYAEKCAKST